MSSSVIVTIVVVLGIIVAGGFLLYFVGDLLMSISNKAKDDEAIKNAQLKKQKELESRVKALENSQGKENSTTILYNGAVVENYNPDEEKKVEEVNEEQEEEKEEVKEEKEEVKEEVKEEPVQEQEEEEEEEEDDQDEASEYIRQRRQELMERLARMQQEEEEEKEENNAVDVSQEEEEKEEKEEKEEEEVKEEPEQPVVPDITEAKFENAIAAGEGEQGLAATMTLEEIEAKLADEQAKLKVNEKELRQCKKEFLPLRRVKRTLENDEKKLRRKEALVAKQKVVLYGVNNYADIDEEKAKKLAEDLDLLDGLKLSVQHCEEVMSKNEQRYPLLEQIFNLLSSRNAEIKNNIKKLQEAIEELKSTSDDSATDSTNAE